MEYVLSYVDDCLVVSQHLEEVLGRLGKYFPLKPGAVDPDKLYLGGKISKLELPNDVHAWAISDSKYIHQALKNLESILDMHGLKLRHNTNSPLPGNYHSDRDETPECDTEIARLYASLIGILRWLVEIGRINITFEVFMMSLYTGMPRECHLHHVTYTHIYIHIYIYFHIQRNIKTLDWFLILPTQILIWTNLKREI